MRLSATAHGNFGGSERSAWLLTRLSAVVLLVMAVVHLLYMHLAVGVENIDYDWVLMRWSNPAWRLFDWLLLSFALAHGAIGVRTVLGDYMPRGMAGLLARWVLYAVAFVFLLIGTQIILSAPRP